MNIMLKPHLQGNRVILLSVCLVLAIAFVEQIFHQDPPCPLCLLQRVAFILIGLGACMNLKQRIRTPHYGLMILAALVGIAVALRQLWLHATPNDPGYGPLFLGLHFYTWSAIGYFFILSGIAIILLFEHELYNKSETMNGLTFIVMIVFLFLILGNVISTLIECGFQVCPANPTA